MIYQREMKDISEGTLAIDFVECQRDSANTKQFEFLELRTRLGKVEVNFTLSSSRQRMVPMANVGPKTYLWGQAPKYSF